MNSGECRSCHAPVIWVVTREGRRMPVDREPVSDGTVVVVNGIVEYVGSDPMTETSLPRYRSHFATCPQAKAWRKR